MYWRKLLLSRETRARPNFVGSYHREGEGTYGGWAPLFIQVYASAYNSSICYDDSFQWQALMTSKAF